MSEGRRRAALLAAAVCVLLFIMDESSFQEELKRKENLRKPSAGLKAQPSAPISTEQGVEKFEQALLLGGNASAWEGLNFNSTVFVQRDLALTPPPLPVVGTEAGEVRVFAKPVLGEGVDVAPSSPATLPHLRWHFKRHKRTNLASASRVSGVLYYTKAGEQEEERETEFEGIYLAGRANLVTVYTQSHHLHLGLELGSADNATMRGSFGGPQGTSFGSLVLPSSSKTAPSSSKAELFAGCRHPVRFDLFLNASQLVLRCANAPNLTLASPVQWEPLPLNLARALEITGYFSLLSIVETLRVGYLFTSLIPSPQASNPMPTSVFAPLSLVGFTWIAITDFYVLELLLSGVWNLAGGKGFWVTAVLLKFVQFLLCHAPFLVLIFVAGFPGQSHDQIRHHFSRCLTWTQLALIFFLIAFEFVRKPHPVLFALAFVSFWLPQIYHNAATNTDLFQVLTLWEVVDLSMQRAAYPMLALATGVLDELAEVDQFGMHTEAKVYNPRGAVACAAWLAVQVLVLYSMHKRGPRWFIPKFCLPKKFDYFQTPAQATTAECAICMLPCDGGGGEIMLTPCQHAFHASCLTPWMQVKLSCPTCRAALPSL